MPARINTYIRRWASKSFFRFLVVGIGNTLVDFAIFNGVLFFLTLSSFETELIAAKTIGFIGATINSYYFNARWTFSAPAGYSIRQYGLFLMVSVIGAAINVAVAYAVFLLCKPYIQSYPILANVAFLAAVAASLMWNYIGYKKIVFISK